MKMHSSPCVRDVRFFPSRRKAGPWKEMRVFRRGFREGVSQPSPVLYTVHGRMAVPVPLFFSPPCSESNSGSSSVLPNDPRGTG